MWVLLDPGDEMDLIAGFLHLGGSHRARETHWARQGWDDGQRAGEWAAGASAVWFTEVPTPPPPTAEQGYGQQRCPLTLAQDTEGLCPAHGRAPSEIGCTRACSKEVQWPLGRPAINYLIKGIQRTRGK